MAYHRIEPFGPEREDLRFGMVASPLINMLQGKRGRKTKPGDWIIISKELKEPQDWRQMKTALKAFAAAHKGEKEE